MNPIRDLGQEETGVRALISAGVNVTLVGVDCLRLREKLRHLSPTAGDTEGVTYCRA
jgi:hypothetical protein